MGEYISKLYTGVSRFNHLIQVFWDFQAFWVCQAFWVFMFSRLSMFSGFSLLFSFVRFSAYSFFCLFCFPHLPGIPAIPIISVISAILVLNEIFYPCFSLCLAPFRFLSFSLLTPLKLVLLSWVVLMFH
jgi:hypothetical protein